MAGRQHECDQVLALQPPVLRRLGRGGHLAGAEPVEFGDIVGHDGEVVGVGEQVLLEPRRERRQVLVVVAQPSLLGLVEAGTRDRVLHVVALDQVA